MPRLYISLKVLSAEERTRTSTRLPGPDPESGASTNSATSAKVGENIEAFALLCNAKSRLTSRMSWDSVPSKSGAGRLKKPLRLADTGKQDQIVGTSARLDQICLFRIVAYTNGFLSNKKMRGCIGPRTMSVWSNISATHSTPPISYFPTMKLLRVPAIYA